MRARPLSLADVREAYEALPPFPEFPGEREWPERLTTPEEFLANGAAVAHYIRAVKRLNGEPDREEMARRREMFPRLWALLFTHFPPDPLA